MEDVEIIELYFSRNEAAIAETKKKYGQLVKSLAMNILRNKSDCEECENDAYMTVWSLIPPNRPENLRAYILKIVRNRALKQYRYNNAEKRSPFAAIPLDELDGCISDSVNYSDSELKEAINGFLSTLNEEHRKIFVLRYWYCQPTADIAERLGISRSKADTILSRTRAKLKKYLGEKEENEP